MYVHCVLIHFSLLNWSLFNAEADCTQGALLLHCGWRGSEFLKKKVWFENRCRTRLTAVSSPSPLMSILTPPPASGQSSAWTMPAVRVADALVDPQGMAFGLQ